jgi:hypothetical protein
VEGLETRDVPSTLNLPTNTGTNVVIPLPNVTIVPAVQINLAVLSNGVAQGNIATVTV